MIRSSLLLLALASLAFAQEPKPSAEDQELDRVLAESGGTAADYARALESHLMKYPKTARRAEFERILAQAAVDLRDKRRVLLYGPAAVDAGSRSPALLDQLTRALLDLPVDENGERALKTARLFAESLAKTHGSLVASKEGGPMRGRRMDETEYALARAYTFEARALANLGRFDESVEAALKGWRVCPTEENARERARSLERGAKPAEALAAFCDGLALAGDRTSAADPSKDRARLAELAAKAPGANAAIGDALLAAYDRVAALQKERSARLRAFDPNFEARAPLDFTLSATNGAPLALATLKGKVVVLDFWATWCGPCRAQHPLYEQVKQRFKTNQNVVFLAVSTDEDREAVAPFLKQQKWDPLTYFEDGMGAALRINSIPTTMILDRSGEIALRMNGYNAERFVDQLTERINDALAAQ